MAARKPRKIPLIKMVEPIRGRRVRLFFSSGLVLQVALPWVRSASRARIVDHGMGLDPGNGRDVSACTLVRLPGEVLSQGEPGWVGFTENT